jgi:hypothetical protein
MQSDHDKAQVLSRWPLEPLLNDRRTWQSVLRAAGSIQSDHEKTQVLNRMLRTDSVEPDVMTEILRAAESIQSDSDKARLLEQVQAGSLSSGPARGAFFSAVRSVSSDSDKRRVLERGLKSAGAPEIARSAIEAAGTIASDHEKAQVLICAAERYGDDATRAVIRKVAQSVSSDPDYRRVMARFQNPVRGD